MLDDDIGELHSFWWCSVHCLQCRRTLRGEGHGAAGWGTVGSVWLQTVGSKVRSFGQWAAATCAAPPVSLPVSTPLRILNHCWSGFPCKWRYINVATFNLLTFSTACYVWSFVGELTFSGYLLGPDHITSGDTFKFSSKTCIAVTGHCSHFQSWC